MKALALALVFVATPALADITLSKNQQIVIVDCAKHPNVTVSGNEIKVTLKATCTSLTVSGNDAKVTGSAGKVEVSGNSNKLDLSVATLNVSGNDNTIRYKRSMQKKPVGVSNSGNGNKIAEAK